MRLLAQYLILIFTVSAFTITPSEANFAAWDDSLGAQPAQEWLSRESAHFSITYASSNQVMADKALNIAERVHSELLPFFGQAPSSKTQIALVDDYDFSNGWATFYPFAQIRLFSSPPDSVNGLEVNDDWLQTLIRHEYVHVLHLEMKRGAPQSLRNVLGRLPVFFPHTISPAFMLEGLATYLESNENLGYGRLQGSFYAMQMRTEVAENRLKSLADVAVPLRNWPLGMQYLYGSYFYQYLAQTYGEEVIQAYLYHYSGQILPGVMQNYSMDRTVDKDFDELWDEYHQWLQVKFSDQIAGLKNSKQQGQNIKPFSLDGNNNDQDDDSRLDQGLFKDVVSSQGNTFYFIHNNGDDTPQLRAFSDQQDVTIIADTNEVLALDVNSQKDIVASRMINWVDGRSWADVFLLVEGTVSKEWQALTKKSRLRNVRWLNNNLMIASRKVQGISELVILNKQGQMQSLWRGQDETTVLGDFDVSSQGDYLVIAVKRALQGWNLERIELAHNKTENNILTAYRIKTWQPISDSKAIENSPHIMPDGRILFSADYDGIYNIFLLNPQTEEVLQLTNMLTGAFAPKLISSADDANKAQVIFQAYTADGFEFRKIELADLSQISQSAQFSKFSLADKQGRYNYPPPFTLDVEKTSPQAYQPWSSLLPRWWFPYYSATPEATQLGLTTGGTDTLARHNYALSFALDWQNELADFSFVYGYDNRYQLGFQRSHEYVDLIGGSKPEFIIEQDRWLFSRNHLFNALEDQLSLNAGILIESEGTLERDDLFSIPCLDGIGQQHSRCEKTLAGLALKFDSRESYLNSSGFSAGRYVDLIYESNDVLTAVADSNYSGGILQGQWQEVFDLPGRRALSLQVLAAKSDTRNEVITIGGDNRLAELSLFGRDDFALRGYAASVQGGNYMNVNRLNFNQWLARIDRGWGILPIGAGDISTDIYVDHGSAWQEGDSVQYLTGMGIDIKIEVLAFYNLMMPIRLSFARGLDKELGQDRASIGISLPY